MSNEASILGRRHGLTKVWTAALVVIGDEILSGRTQDRNIAQLATWLNVQGIRLSEVRVVPDVEDRIVDAVNALRTTHDYLFTTGGIGPTHDDITVDSMAAALGVPVVIHPEARLRMARVPQGADLISNSVSGAPGIRIGNIFIMAGVPHITAGMLHGLTGTLEGGRPVVSLTIGGFVPESEVADLLRTTERTHAGAHGAVSIGSYPFFREGRVGSNFVVRSEEPALAQACIDELASGLAAAGYEVVAGGI